jgi:hypothetical protein
MLLPGAEELGMTRSQCLEVLESVEDTIDFFVSRLTYLMHAESQKAQPDLHLIAQWEAMDSEAFDLQYRLPGASIETYQQVLETYRQRSRELRAVVNSHMTASFTSSHRLIVGIYRLLISE